MLEQMKALAHEILGPEVTALLGRIYWAVIAPAFGQPTLHWAFILCSIAAGAGFFLFVLATPGQRSARAALRYVFPRAIYTHPSAVLDYKFFLVTQYVLKYLWPVKFIVAITGILYISEAIRWALERTFGPAPAAGEPGWGVLLAFTVVFTLAYDLARWVVHYLHHRVRVLWEFHKVHHSAAVLTPFSSFRAHPVEQATELFMRTVFTGVVTAFFAYYYPSIQPLSILGFGAISFVFHLVGHLRHSHVPLGFGWFDRLFVSPHMHQLHHSADPRHFDRNFGFIFSWWDRMAGTLYLPHRDERFELGLPAEAGDYATLKDLYFRPFVAAGRLLLGRPPVRADA